MGPTPQSSQFGHLFSEPSSSTSACIETFFSPIGLGFGAMQRHRNGGATLLAHAQAMAVAGARDGRKPARRQMPAGAPSVESLIRELGGTQHLERERAILRLRASLRNSGVVRTRRRTAGPAAARHCEQRLVMRCRRCPDHRVRTAKAHLQRGFVDRLAPKACLAERCRGKALRRLCVDCRSEHWKILQHKLYAGTDPVGVSARFSGMGVHCCWLPATAGGLGSTGQGGNQQLHKATC